METVIYVAMSEGDMIEWFRGIKDLRAIISGEEMHTMTKVGCRKEWFCFVDGNAIWMNGEGHCWTRGWA
jgi:hypothetical protein